jgi:hypothetical protein
MKKVLLIVPIIAAAMLLSACSAETVTTQASTYSQESKKLAENQKTLTGAVPIPTLQTSQERLNIKRRAELFDNENKVSYIYLTSFGKVMTFYTVKGKVSSLRSYMTPQDQLVDANGQKCSREEWTNYAKPCYTIQSPDVDGSYGENVDGIFFFTTEGAYVEWKGDYMMSDQPLKLSTQPELIREIK